MFFINLFIYYYYFWLHWVFAAARGLSPVAVSSGLSCCGAWALGTRASVVVACGLSSCGTRAQLLRGVWDPPGPGPEPVSPALAGGLLTTALPGKSVILLFGSKSFIWFPTPALFFFAETIIFICFKGAAKCSLKPFYYSCFKICQIILTSLVISELASIDCLFAFSLCSFGSWHEE